jgi:ABC-type glycerol-3-phosphate transport system substrate-binding protein
MHARSRNNGHRRRSVIALALVSAVLAVTAACGGSSDGSGAGGSSNGATTDGTTTDDAASPEPAGVDPPDQLNAIIEIPQGGIPEEAEALPGGKENTVKSNGVKIKQMLHLCLWCKRVP